MPVNTTQAGALRHSRTHRAKRYAVRPVFYFDSRVMPKCGVTNGS